MPDGLRAAGPHLDALLLGVPHGDVLERVRVDVGGEPVPKHEQDVAVERGVTPWASS